MRLGIHACWMRASYSPVLFLRSPFSTRVNSQVTDDSLVKYFSAFGSVKEAKVVLDRVTGNSKG